MKNNSVVTYDEIVEAIKSIIDCSINNDYENDFNYLNVKYESELDNKVDSNDEKLLYYSLLELKNRIEDESKIIRQALEEQLESSKSNIVLNSEYILGYESRKLSANIDSINKLKEHSLDINVLNDIPTTLPTALDKLNEVDTNKVLSEFEKKVILDFPEYFDSDIPVDDIKYEEKEYDYEKIEMINKALKKAKQIGDKDLIDKLQKMYDEEIK